MTAGGTLASALSLVVSLVVPALLFGAPACSSSSNKGSSASDDGGGTSYDNPTLGGDGGISLGGASSGGTPVTYNTSKCSSGGSTTISGTVYDPAMVNPVYNVAVYVPGLKLPLPAIPQGVSCAACSDLYSAPQASAVTDAAGTFKITNAPDGANIPLVVQVGKWQHVYTLANVTACQDNPQPAKSLRLPKNHMEGNIPDIAISTGGADSLECLPLRMGLDAAEYVPGPSSSGRIHIFQGYMGATTMPAAPMSYAGLWDSSTDLEKFDIALLSCEGHTTAGGVGGTQLMVQQQQALLDYANAGGRVFASHFHYAWFTSGPFNSLATPPLMTWTAATVSGSSETIDDGTSFFGTLDTTTAAGAAFPEGVALQAWLGNVGALTGGELPYFYARDNVVAVNSPAQDWLDLDKSKLSANDTTKLAPDLATVTPQYVSFDLPLDVGTESSKCGRVVYSDLHVSGGPGALEPALGSTPAPAPDYGLGNSAGVAPSGCAMHPLTPQEKALEFMIFDLSSCLIPIGQAPPTSLVQ
jgi:hypothetical protein